MLNHKIYIQDWNIFPYYYFKNKTNTVAQITFKSTTKGWTVTGHRKFKQNLSTVNIMLG